MRCRVQVSAAYSEDHSVQRNNFSLIKAFASKWPTLPPPPDALLPHITAGGPQVVSGAKGRLSRQFADRRLFGLRLASVGTSLSSISAPIVLHMTIRHIVCAQSVRCCRNTSGQPSCKQYLTGLLSMRTNSTIC